MSKEFYFDFKKVAESNTVEGVVDFDKVTDTYNEQYKQYYAKEVVRIADEQKGNWETDLYKGLGIESVKDKDSLDLYVKQLGGSANEQTEHGGHDTPLESSRSASQEAVEDFLERNPSPLFLER